MTKQEAIQEQIDDIMDTFDFGGVHKWMTTSKWKWGSGKEGAVPEIYEIKKEARARMKEAAKSGGSSTGGFTASCYEGNDDGEGRPWIRLVLSFGYSTYNDGTSYDNEQTTTN
jgi:hypothetical protein